MPDPWVARSDASPSPRAVRHHPLAGASGLVPQLPRLVRVLAFDGNRTEGPLALVVIPGIAPRPKPIQACGISRPFAAGAGELETRAHAPLLGLQGRRPGPIVPA